MHSVGTPWAWAGFVAAVVALLALDLGVFHREDRAPSAREALAWTGAWIGAALAFGALVWWRWGATVGLEYLTGYLVEKSLSVDNLFVFVVVFGALGIPAAYQRRVLFWGIFGALGLRAGMIAGGAALLARFSWLVHVFGGFLVLTAVRLFLARAEAPHPERSPAFRLVRRLVATTSRLDGHAFVVREGGRRVATPLLVALLGIELGDVVFALDSIPAVFGVTRDPFVVFTSNVFAILGLRSLYFAVARLVDRFRYLKIGLSAVLAFVGAKMLAAPWIHVHAAASLAIVAALLGAAIAASAVRPRRAAGSSARGSPGRATG